MTFKTKKSHTFFIILVSALILCVAISGVEAKSKKYIVSMTFFDFCSGYGKHGEKLTVTLDNDIKRLAKKTFKFKDILKHDNKASISFGTKNAKLDQFPTITLDAEDSSSNNGVTQPFQFEFNKHKYHEDVSLDDFGCNIPV